MNTMLSFEQARERKALRDAEELKLPDFKRFKRAYPPSSDDSKKGAALAEIKFCALISREGLRTNIRDPDTGGWFPKHWPQQDPETLIAAAKREGKRVSEARLGGKVAYVLNMAKWLNDGEWQS